MPRDTVEDSVAERPFEPKGKQIRVIDSANDVFKFVVLAAEHGHIIVALTDNQDSWICIRHLNGSLAIARAEHPMSETRDAPHSYDTYPSAKAVGAVSGKAARSRVLIETVNRNNSMTILRVLTHSSLWLRPDCDGK